MSEWLTCLKCGTPHENMTLCHGCGGVGVTITAQPLFISPGYARDVAKTHPTTTGSAT